MVVCTTVTSVGPSALPVTVTTLLPVNIIVINVIQGITVSI